MQFEPADKNLFFAGHLLQVYFGHVDEATVTPSQFVYTVVGDPGQRVRPTAEVHAILLRTRHPGVTRTNG